MYNKIILLVQTKIVSLAGTDFTIIFIFYAFIVVILMHSCKWDIALEDNALQHILFNKCVRFLCNQWYDQRCSSLKLCSKLPYFFKFRSWLLIILTGSSFFNRQAFNVYDTVSINYVPLYLITSDVILQRNSEHPSPSQQSWDSLWISSLAATSQCYTCYSNHQQHTLVKGFWLEMCNKKYKKFSSGVHKPKYHQRDRATTWLGSRTHAMDVDGAGALCLANLGVDQCPIVGDFRLIFWKSQG